MKGTIRSAIIRAVPALAAASAIFLWCGQAQAGPAPSYRVLHTFCARGFTCPEGANPASDQLVRDAGGDLFGTAESGGQSGDGTIYELVPKHGGARYFKKVLRTFCVTSKCSTGGHPFSGVIKDTVVVPTYGRASVDFTADQPGLTLFHCHIQHHMDYGFKALLRYS